jgi:dihydrofolate synthase/folylpolyglutamate synthase
MKEVIRSADPRIAALIKRQATQDSGADHLGLERIGALLDRLGRPQDRLPPVLHVAGTNGKGSTIAFLRAALEAAGLRVHAFTSPHLVRYNERIRLAGSLIDDDRLARLMGVVLDQNEAVGATLFEVNTAAAFLAFNEVAADACILEVGLGGRLDATNIVERPCVTAIAGLGLDHQQFLGRRLADIAGEKAGIAKAGVPLVTQAYPRSASERIARIAADAGAHWLPRGGAWDAPVRGGRLHYTDGTGTLDLPLPRLPGKHQAMNAALAVAMLRHQDAFAVPAPALSAGVETATWPARLQRLSPGPLVGTREAWLDGGHNPSAAREVAAFAADRLSNGKPLHLIFASLSSKDPAGMLRPFRGIAARVHCVPIPEHNCFTPDELVAVATDLGFDADPHACVDAALRSISSDARVLIFGSLYLAGDVLAANGQPPA